MALLNSASVVVHGSDGDVHQDEDTGEGNHSGSEVQVFPEDTELLVNRKHDTYVAHSNGRNDTASELAEFTKRRNVRPERLTKVVEDSEEFNEATSKKAAPNN